MWLTRECGHGCVRASARTNLAHSRGCSASREQHLARMPPRTLGPYRSCVLRWPPASWPSATHGLAALACSVSHTGPRMRCLWLRLRVVCHRLGHAGRARWLLCRHPRLPGLHRSTCTRPREPRLRGCSLGSRCLRLLTACLARLFRLLLGCCDGTTQPSAFLYADSPLTKLTLLGWSRNCSGCLSWSLTLPLCCAAGPLLCPCALPRPRVQALVAHCCARGAVVVNCVNNECAYGTVLRVSLIAVFWLCHPAISCSRKPVPTLARRSWTDVAHS